MKLKKKKQPIKRFTLRMELPYWKKAMERAGSKCLDLSSYVRTLINSDLESEKKNEISVDESNSS